MPKKLIVCADGTWNDEDRTRTNVAKLHRALQTWHVEGVDQWVCYVSGVGTSFGEAIRGGAFGYGLSRNILQAYYFLLDNYEPDAQLYFFGFSRGAYTVRSLAGFIRNSGLLRLECRNLVGKAFDLYRARSKKSGPREKEATEFRNKYSYQPDIEFIGVWDTVGSLGIPTGKLKLISLLFHVFGYDWRFHDPQLSTKVKHAYHALAIHERRGTFVPTLWEKQPDAPAEQVLEQVWFPGVHCDVGGGYNAAGLSDEALEWMVRKAESCDLLFRRSSTEFGLDNAPDPFSRLHDSDTSVFRLIDALLRNDKGLPRRYGWEAKYCAGISHSALMLRHFSRRQEWPPTFRRALDDRLAEITADDLRVGSKPGDARTFHQRLRKNTAVVSQPIFAANTWNGTGILLQEGKCYSIRLADPLAVRDGSIPVTTLDGWPSRWRRRLFLPVAIFRRQPFDPWFALIGSVNKRHLFRIAYDGFEITAPATGELFCYFNDVPFRYKNNQGSVRLSVAAI